VWNEIKSLLTSICGAIIAGWSSKLIALVTDPFTSIVVGLGWIGVLFVVVVLIKQTFDDYEDYMAMGIFAFIAIITLFLPWDIANLLLFGSVVVLVVIKKDFEFRPFGN